jgi:hypothetical protein
MVFLLASLTAWAQTGAELADGVIYKIDLSTERGKVLTDKIPVVVRTATIRGLSRQRQELTVKAELLELKKGLPSGAEQPVLNTGTDGSQLKIDKKPLKLLGNLDVYGSIRTGPGSEVPILFQAGRGNIKPIHVEVSFKAAEPQPNYYFWEPRIQAWVPAEAFIGTEIINFKQWHKGNENRQYFSYDIVAWPKDDRADAAGG